MDRKKLLSDVSSVWDKAILPSLKEYIAIPNKSPAYDPDWKANGHMDRAVKLMSDWCYAHAPKGMTLEVVEMEGRTPVIMIEVAGQSDKTVLLYGHLDKQPEMEGWDEGLGPWIPVEKDGKLYGRGGADDGYAIFASLTALKTLQEHGLPHARCVILIEGCEESGSYDLPFYIEHLKERIGSPDLIVCLDSGCANYEQLWLTTSLRGVVGGDLTVEILKEGSHSGMASGIVPSSFRIIRQLLDRIEDKSTGEILVEEFNVEIPGHRIHEATKLAELLGNKVHNEYPFVQGAEPVSKENHQLLLNRTWRPTLCVVGADGLPAASNAGNVLRPRTTLRLSLRVPPRCDAQKAIEALKVVLEKDPPYGAKVTFSMDHADAGWEAPETKKWLADAIDSASLGFFGKPAMQEGIGGSIPFMGMLGQKFPEAQFVITGLLGPKSNAHGPNEFLHIDMAKKLTASVAYIVHAHYLNGLVI